MKWISDMQGTLTVHDPELCEGHPCPIHHPSDHKMKHLPRYIRFDAFSYGLVERICKHGVGHPDPDSVAFLSKGDPDSNWGIHGCDGCCT